MQKLIARLYVPVCKITAAKNKFVPVFSYFIKLSPTNAYGLVDNYVRDRCNIISSLYKTNTSLRRTVEAGPEGVRLREV